MNCESMKMLEYLGFPKLQFIIPIYQRKYNWSKENCWQLYSDLKKIVQSRRKTHFFGSVVYSVGDGTKIRTDHIIDGQQRLTTITLLLLAIRNLIEEGKKISQDYSGCPDSIRNIYNTFLICPEQSADNQVKLVLGDDDRKDLRNLIEPMVSCELNENSNLTKNYRYFYDWILKEDEITIDELYSAMKKLEIITVTLKEGDYPQHIFESINSTGMPLFEGDKICNYMLMGLSTDPDNQKRLYNYYWKRIEECTTYYGVSEFVRFFLSIHNKRAPANDKIYLEFKKFAENDCKCQMDSFLDVERLMKDYLYVYADYYKQIRSADCKFKDRKLKSEMDKCLCRLNKLNFRVI